jgi:L-ascorbate metabolism protein UlaG (beta-lactamase superfamily)
LVEANPGAALYADPQTAAQLGDPWRAVNPGDELAINGLRVRGRGGVHAIIHPEIPAINNISYLIGDDQHAARLMHPGDSLFIPGEPVDVLALPAAAPWMKISEGVEYLRAVNPQRAIPIHQGIVNPDAYAIYYQRYSEMGRADFQVLRPENATEI